MIEVEELSRAELLLTQTLPLDPQATGDNRNTRTSERNSFNNQVVGSKPMCLTSLRFSFSISHKHVGATLTDNAEKWAETKKRVQTRFFAVRRIAKLWSLGTHRGRGKPGKRAGLANARLLHVMKCVLEGALLACGTPRVWNLVQERKANQVLSSWSSRS